MGGEYLPSVDKGEIEIARISLATFTADQISVRARLVNELIHYRVVDEHETSYNCGIENSKEPLTLSELCRLLDQTSIEDGDEEYIGLICQKWEHCYEGIMTAQACLDFVSVSSAFYPELCPLYEYRGQQWKAGLDPSKKKALSDTDELVRSIVDEVFS